MCEAVVRSCPYCEDPGQDCAACHGLGTLPLSSVSRRYSVGVTSFTRTDPLTRKLVDFDFRTGHEAPQNAGDW